MVYVDESGIDNFLQREFGRSKRGQKVYGEKRGIRFIRESFIAGLSMGSIIAPMCYEGTCDGVLFNFWLQKFLVPELKKGQVIIMDNASFHKSIQTKDIIKNAGCELIFLPPYSPDLNPIEKVWAHIKSKIKSFSNKFKTLQEGVNFAFQNIS